MVNTKLDYDLYCSIKNMQDRLTEIKNDLMGNNQTTSYDKNAMLDTLNVSQEELQKVMCE